MIAKVLSGERPERPKDPNVTDGLWALTRQCWEEDPRRRPEITEVAYYMRKAMAVQQDNACRTGPEMDDATVGCGYPWGPPRSTFLSITPSRAAFTRLKDEAYSGFSSRFLWHSKLETIVPESISTSSRACGIKDKRYCLGSMRPGWSGTGACEGAQHTPSGSRKLFRKTRTFLLSCSMKVRICTSVTRSRSNLAISKEGQPVQFRNRF